MTTKDEAPSGRITGSAVNDLERVRRARRLLADLLRDGVIRRDEYLRLLRNTMADAVVLRLSRASVTEKDMRVTLSRVLVALDTGQLVRGRDVTEHLTREGPFPETSGLLAMWTNALLSHLERAWSARPTDTREIFRQLRQAHPGIVSAVNERVPFGPRRERKRCVLFDVERARAFVAEPEPPPPAA
jgi:hypothetical protein